MISNGYNPINFGGATLGAPQDISAQISQMLGGITAPAPQMGGGGQGGGGGFLGGMIGNAEQPGWGNFALGGLSTLLNGFMGMQQYGLAKRSLTENRRQFDMNWDAQRTTVNTQLEDRQRARVAADPTGYESVSNYMSRNAIK